MPLPLLPLLARNPCCNCSCCQSHHPLHCTPPSLLMRLPSLSPLPSLLPATLIAITIALSPLPSVSRAPIASWLLFFISPMEEGGLGPSFAPPIQRTVDSSNVAGALSFWRLCLLCHQRGSPAFALGIGADRIAFAIAMGPAPSNDYHRHGNSCYKHGKDYLALCAGSRAHNAVLAPLVGGGACLTLPVWRRRRPMMGGLCILVVCELHTLFFLLGSHAYVRQNIGKQGHIGNCRKGLFKTNQLIALNWGESVGFNKKMINLEYLWQYLA